MDISAPFRNGELEESCDAILEDLKHACEITLDEYVIALLPRLPPDIDVTHVFQSIQANQPKLWTPFDVAPASSGRAENAIFKELKPLIDGMVGTARQMTTSEPTFSFVFEPYPNSTPRAAERPSTFRPDGLLVTKDAPSAPYSFYNTGLTLEFKRFLQQKTKADVSSSP